MSFDIATLRRLIAAHGRVARVVIATKAGSVPRGPGTAMVIWCDGQEGTIGGGALEFEATDRARIALTQGDRLDKVPLGPGLGQCCGGGVTLLTEIWDQARLDQVTDYCVRPMPGTAPQMPLKVSNRLRAARNGSRAQGPEVVQGWMIEPLTQARHDLWLWGAGHVGRAIAGVMAPLPDWQVTWIDTAAERFPEAPAGPRRLIQPQPDPTGAPSHAHHLILTYSHALDLDLCHQLLSQHTGSIGLIGSATKWARFRSRLTALGHGDTHRITCPIGDPALGKHPQAIALGVATELIRHRGLLTRTEVRQA